MKTEENVCENANKTGHTASAERENKGSAVLGKFKDVNALLAAYGALEAEFTRRSQRLKALEKEAENLRNVRGAASENAGREAEKSALGKGIGAPSVAETTDRGDRETLAHTGAAEAAEADDAAPKNLEPALKPDFECLNAGENENVSKSENAFESENVFEGARNGTAETFGAVSAAETVGTSENGATEEKTEEVSGTVGTVGTVGNGGTEEAATEEELFRAATTNERVRLKIIGEYLSSLSKPNAPLVRGGTGALVLSPARAKTVEDAGLMALRYFKDGKK